jgi:hypothetical protein
MLKIILFVLLAPLFSFGSVTVVVNGSNHTIPQTNERGWGNAVTAWIQAISTYAIQPTGGTYTLSADLDLGATYGIKTAYVISKTTNPSSAGYLRLAVTDYLGWRNNANNGNLLLLPNGSNELTYNSQVVDTASNTLTLTNKTMSGASNTFSNIPLASAVTGTLPIGNGGTGQTTQAAAFNALHPMTTTGDMIYSSSGTTSSRLAIGSANQILKVSSG